ncbi:hypothetical protein CWC11_11460 [Pseudoalteromonas sp. S3178]|uniref:heparan-alpha-glucosaminide N-acetyltransferase domain-containing protein n=1 Tax=Pseudoalteromonas sp. S3178 TaxID=579532 RepID=UPI00110A8A42|nr:heparan-alpha-glucosaminide N-acetyltransferase domain-containing protein [Pseudoalteromonas sp. S3178]TMP04449.1 hypothetical protein CWC11_11460 [Pseudoalteromonas sp. S3178]
MNTRLKTIDLARGASVFIMILVHTLWMYSSTTLQSESLFGAVIHILGKGTASFLVAMGLSMALSRRQTPMLLIKRGIQLLLLAYLMNAAKFWLPIEVFNTMPEAFINAYGWQSPLSAGQLQFMVLTGDILQLAGVSLLLFGALNIARWKTVWIACLAIAIALVSQFVRGQQFALSPYISDLFFANNYQVYFPVFPWISAILTGYVLGRLYINSEHNAAYLFSVCAKLGAALLIVGTTWLIADFKGQFGNFFHLNGGGIIYLIGLNLFGLAVIEYVFANKFNGPITRALLYASKHVTALYIIQWVLICWLMGVFGYHTQSLWPTLCLMALMGLLTFAVHKVYLQTKQSILAIKQKPKRTA